MTATAVYLSIRLDN